MYYKSLTLKIFCVVVTLSLTLAQFEEILNKINHFNQDLFHRVENQNREKNVIMSPFSVQSIIGMLYEGAEGDTAVEVEQKFTMPASTSLLVYFTAALTHLSNQPDITIANKLYFDENVHVKEEYKTLLNDQFRSSIEAVDFLCAEETADSINEWVSTKTNNLIPQLVNPSTFAAETNLFVVNTITFSGEWKSKFDEAKTEMANFYLNAQKSVKVPMMYQKGKFLYSYIYKLKSQLLILPYKTGGLSFVILLPYTHADIYNLEQNIKNIDISNLVSTATELEIDVALPKFKAEFEFDLKDILQNMGLGKLFGDSAELNGISSNTPLSVSQFIHKAVINVDEKGSTVPPPPPTAISSHFAVIPVRANKPFIYFIKDVKNNILFSGSYKGPEN